ncbi:1-deoxy-D-xylulose-5-phosphate reductoisomerase [Enemella dayhoffiae]|uniref:1-deoxy-D-xylulose 5-phosphate reductoisomerase n=1 Tax=Enemella dayhoffiae TaxID=2016507 RepID=A0A255H644_9ACTN|nr:1-deoxy-D-xylulose-5-phosphate reductoisomerase [Enemella dayhoffiae]OYO23081.1 1-deoxy-D-xylulose-5-phosphate reductoisomerase [Enemella dayhoffiae]
MREVIILGSTGSIGTQALEVIGERPDSFRVVGLAAGGSNIPLLAQQVLDHRPRVVALSRAQSAQDLQLALYAEAKLRGWGTGDTTLPKILAGPDAATELAAEGCDVVLNGITGAAGLGATLATLAAGTTLALANKESLVIGGRLVTDAADDGQLVAVDSEHSAIAQCLRAGRRDEVRKVIVTASGGPFRGWTRERMADVTPEQAMQHPTWNMGRVITINSATLVNKALEVLEAALLYDVELADIEPVVHPQSIVHSMVEFVDGSTMAQCSPPDMKLPIALGLTWPDRVAGAAYPCDWTRATSWTFEPIDHQAFPAIELIKRAGSAAGTAPAVYNAANEVAVDAFCEGRIGFLDIVDTIASVLEEHLAPAANEPHATGDGVGSRLVGSDRVTVPTVLAADQWARQRADQLTAGNKE